MRKLIVKEYDFNTSELILKDLNEKTYQVYLEFRNVDAPCRGSVIYMPEKYLNNYNQKLLFGQIGISPLARWMPNSENEFLLLHPKNSNSAILLQRYYP